MLARLGLPAPQLSTKLYGTIALFLVVVFALAVATLHFAGRVEEQAGHLREDGIERLALLTRVQALLEKHRLAAGNAEGAAQDQRAYADLGATIAGLLQRLPPPHAEDLSQRFALLASQGASVFDVAQAGERGPAHAMRARFGSAADGLMLEVLTLRATQLRDMEEALGGLAALARSFITWVCALLALTGLAIGPLGLLLLRRVLTRLDGIGGALLRLARNDTSVDVPGLADEDEFGQLARSVSVFKAKSIELLGKKADFERLNLQLDAAINNMPLGLSMFDAQERLLVCNRRYAEMYEVPSELTQPGTAHCALWEHRARKGARHSETRHGTAGGVIASPAMRIEFATGRTIAVSRQPLRGGGWVSLHEDITERRRQQEAMAHQAHHDALTGLANRVLFREQLEQSLQRPVRGQGFAVLCLDLDHFKAVNDTLGHPIGDQLLKQVSQRLLGCVRHGDLVARLGGDEFAIIQASVRDAAQTDSLAARIVETVSAPYEIEGHRVEIGTSVGVTLAPRDGTDTELLLKNADLALYRTKEAGRRGYAFFKPEMSDVVESRRNLEADLRQALEDDDLDLALQPIVCLETQRIAGFEAAPRWRHGRHGLMPAHELAAVAEDAGLVAELGAWTLARACAQAARWPRPIKVAVDIAALQLARRTLIDSVLQALAQSGLAPERLELEVAESVLLQEGKHTLAMLHQLRQLGVATTLDDFGTGHGALSTMRAFPFDKIKIDRGYIGDMERSDDARTVVAAVIALGRSLGMTTVAAGVENHEQLESMRAWGCAQAQGYLLGPPVPAAEAEALLAGEGGCVRSAA